MVHLFADVSNSQDVHRTPQTPHKPRNESIETAPIRQINPSEMQHHGVPTMGSALLWHLLQFALSLLSFSHNLSISLKLTLLRFWQWPTTPSLLQISHSLLFSMIFETCPTQWPTAFPVSSRIPMTSWQHNAGDNPQTLHKQSDKWCVFTVKLPNNKGRNAVNNT